MAGDDMAGEPICVGCGYVLSDLAEAAPGVVVCPECGSSSRLAAAPRPEPWPGVVRLGVVLCWPFAVNVAAFLAVVGIAVLVGVENLPYVPRALALVIVIASMPLTGLGYVKFRAAMLATAHAPGPTRSGTELRVFGAGVGVNAVVAGVGYFVAGLLGAW